MTGNATEEKITETIMEVAADLDYIIYESSAYLKGERSQIIVKIDRLKGISHSDCEIFSKALNSRLDEEGLLPNYSIEISSPGLSRKIRSIEEFERFIGSPVKVIFEVEGKRSIFKGLINNVIDTIIELKSDDEEIRINYEDVVKANLEY